LKGTIKECARTGQKINADVTLVEKEELLALELFRAKLVSELFVGLIFAFGRV